MANPFVHMELNTPDLAAAKEFYGQLFGWTFQDAEVGPGMIYSLFRPDNGPGGGMMSMPGVPHNWLSYVGVDDIHASTEKARTLGAKVIRDVTEVPGHGHMSILLDPTGVPIALFQPSQT